MAIRIVDPNPDKSVVKQVICRNCGVKLEYTPADLKQLTGRDISGCSEVTKYFICPNCAHEVITDQW